jgi:hypothetical protein
MTDDDTAADPFAPDQAPGIQLIVQMRIYDTLMALLTKVDKDTAKELMQLHAAGKLMGTTPFFDGTFLSDGLDLS